MRNYLTKGLCRFAPGELQHFLASATIAPPPPVSQAPPIDPSATYVAPVPTSPTTQQTTTYAGGVAVPDSGMNNSLPLNTFQIPTAMQSAAASTGATHGVPMLASGGPVGSIHDIRRHLLKHLLHNIADKL